MEQPKTLNSDQKIAADGFFDFLMGTDKEMIISGPGGVGKTTLMGHMIDNIMPRYLQTCQLMQIDPKYTDVMMTATTNKAAEVLGDASGRPTQTIHSFLNLKVQEDFKTGKSKLIKTGEWKVHSNMIIFIDECSMIDTHLRRHLLDATLNCKIVYVGDHCQLAPIMEPISPIYTDNLKQYVLLQQMRNNGQPALMQVCTQLRDTVETGKFKPIKIVPGVIDHLSPEEVAQEVNSHFLEPTTEHRILAYTNKKVVEYNDYIRQIREYPSDQYEVGEVLINNSAVKLRGGMLRVEEELKILEISKDIEKIKIQGDIYLEVRNMTLQDNFGGIWTNVPIPVDREYFTRLVKYYAGEKDWYTYFQLKNSYPDLRPRDACTVHKSQGSTYGTSFIDLTDVSMCRDPVVAARLLYVAFTRAKSRVVLFGDLAKKFGGLTY